MWSNGADWPQWPQNMPSTAEETSHWAELARQWAAANNPQNQVPPGQFPPPPPPPPPLEDQDDRVFAPPQPPSHPSNNFADNNLRTSFGNYERQSQTGYPQPGRTDPWQYENVDSLQPPKEVCNRYAEVYEHPSQYFRSNAPPTFGMHTQMSCLRPPPPIPFNGEETWAYQGPYHQLPDYPPHPPPPPQGPITHPPPPRGPLFPIGGSGLVVPPGPSHYTPRRLPPPRSSNFPVPEHIMPAFNQAAGPWLQQQVPPQQQPRSALPAWLRDELEKLEKQKRKEQEKLDLAASKDREGRKDSSEETERNMRVRRDSDGAVHMDEGSDRGSPIQMDDSAVFSVEEDDEGTINLGKVRSLSSHPSDHGGSIYASPKIVPEIESAPLITDAEFRSACARLKEDVITEYNRFIKDSLTDLLLEVTTAAINEVCEETLLQARLAAYGKENDIDDLEDDDEVGEDDEVRGSPRDSPLAGAGILGLAAYVSENESEDGSHADVDLSRNKSATTTSIEEIPPIKETKENGVKKKDTERETESADSLVQPSRSPQITVEGEAKKKSSKDEKEVKRVEKSKSSRDDERKKSTSSFSKNQEAHSHRHRDKDKISVSKSKKSKTDHKDVPSSSSKSNEKRRRSKSHKRSRSRSSSVSSRRHRKRTRSRSRSYRHTRRRPRSRQCRRSRSRSLSSSRSSRTGHHHRHHRKRH